MRPAECIKYFWLRESSSGASDVDLTTLLQEKTGLSFDLPTEVQWEYACRAGTSTDFNNGMDLLWNKKDGKDENHDPHGVDVRLDNLCRYRKNGGFIPDYADRFSELLKTNGTAKVGSYTPNRWGLYDMHGNVSEWCREGLVRGSNFMDYPFQSASDAEYKWLEELPPSGAIYSGRSIRDSYSWRVGVRLIISLEAPECFVGVSDTVDILTYRVRFEANGGAGEMADQVFVYNQEQALSSCLFTREGYHASGWSACADSIEASWTENAVVSNLTDVTNATVTLYAVWAPNRYAVSFDANGGVCSTASMPITYDASYGALPTATRSGMALVGWFTSQVGGFQIFETNKVLIAENHVLYAHWGCAVEFNANGGSCVDSCWGRERGSVYGTLPIPTREGYAFVGWFTSASGGRQVTAEETVSGNVTLYAHWTNICSVEFNANGGSGGMTYSCTCGVTLGLLPTATRIGYVFEGWFTAQTGGTEVLATTVVKGTVTYYARWTPIRYSVRFHANGGSGEMTDQTFEYDGVQSLSQCGFTRTGYTFVGWSAREGANVAEWMNGENGANLTAIQDGVVDLWAVWQPVDGDEGPGTGKLYPIVKSMTARQRYPWNGKVDIVVTIQGDLDQITSYECAFGAINNETMSAVSVTDISQIGDDIVSGNICTRRYVWNAITDVGTVKIDDLSLNFLLEDKSQKELGGVQLWENGPYWAECNVGAANSEEMGYYFWWGDTVGYRRNANNDGWVSVKEALRA